MSSTGHDTAEATGTPAKLLRRVTDDKRRVLLTRKGKKVAALVPVEDLRRLQQLDAEDRADIAAAKEALAEQGREPPEPYAKVRKRLGL